MRRRGVFKDFAGRCTLYGVDVSEEFLRDAEASGYITRLVDAGADALPFGDGFFDAVIAGEVIEHVVNTDWLMTEVNRVMRNDGRLIISIPNVNQWISVLMMLFFDLPPRYSARFRAPHVRDFTHKTMRMCIQEFGFSIVRRHGTGLFIPGARQNVLTGLTGYVPRLATEIVFDCRKERSVVYDASKAVVLESIY